MKTPMQELIEDINIEKKLGYITENAANRILDYINNLYLKEEKEQIIDAHIEGQRVFDKYQHTQWTNDQAEHYYNQTYNQNK